MDLGGVPHLHVFLAGSSCCVGFLKSGHPYSSPFSSEHRSKPTSSTGSSFACVRSAIHVQNFTGGEGGVDQKQSCVDYFLHLTDPADRVQPFEEVMGFRFMHGSVDLSRRYGVYTNAFLRVFNGESPGHLIQCALQHDLNVHPYTCDPLGNP